MSTVVGGATEAASASFTISLPNNVNLNLGSTSTTQQHLQQQQQQQSSSETIELIKCGLCPQTFTENVKLQEHTRTHFIGTERERQIDYRLVRQRLQKKKKKRPQRYLGWRRLRRILPKTSTPFMYTCTQCNVTLARTSAWLVHKAKHAGRTWKCQFCSRLVESSSALRLHLESVHKMDRIHPFLGVLQLFP